VIGGLKPYAEQKNAGVSWLGKVPAHWEIKPGFAAYREKQQKNRGLVEKRVLSLSYGRIVIKSEEKLHGLVPESFETYQVVNPGDIIIRSTDLQNDWNSLRIGLVRDRGIITSAYICLNMVGPLLPEYGYQQLNAFDLMKVFYGMGSGLRQNLDFSDFKRMPILIPTHEEQSAIVRFLDNTNGRIERAIQAKNKLIALLNEQKRAIIQRAVTRGLDPHVSLRPSGIPWLGDIPSHWEISRVKNEFRCLNPPRIPLNSVERGQMTARLYDYYGASGVIDKVDDYLFDDELLLIAEDGANLVLRNLPLAIIACGKFWVNNHAHILKPKRGKIEYVAGYMETLNYQPWISGADKDVFDSIIVVTDRRVLDKQIRDTIKQFAQVGATVGHAEHSGDLQKFIESGKKIIISTVQKFPFILDEIAKEGKAKTFAIIIDEAHSSQGGKTAAAMSEALSDPEDTINDELEKRMRSRKLLTNASYFAFTATPKNKTLELFGEPLPADAEGKVKHRPFHSYTMKQAIQERFILDVLKSYTPVDSYYKLVKTIESDPAFDVKRARKKLRRYVESHDKAIKRKAEIMIDHFHEQVLDLNKIGGQARAMVVCNGVERAIDYFHAFRSYLTERKSPYQAIIAFSGDHEDGGVKVSESKLNGFSSNDIVERIQEDPYRFLICADKFQTGYDEPLLHTMYVDKTLSGIKAVQTLSRLNRAHPKKHDVFVLDFMNDSKTITESFAPYYRTTLLSDETDPNKLHDLKAALDNGDVYSRAQVESIVELYLGGAARDTLDPILDVSVATYKNELDENKQVKFKGDAKAFTRTYDFLSSILPYTSADWEKLSIFLNLLIPKLPAPIEEDLSKGILEAIDMDSYRTEKKAAMKILLSDDNPEIEPVPTGGGGGKPERQIDVLSNILKTFNEQFGTLFTDADRVARRIKDDIAPKVAVDPAYLNAKKNTPNTARIELDAALMRVIGPLLKDDTEFYKQFVQNDSFRRFVTDVVHNLTT
jgi:type I restriction enzyme R subunit